MKKFFLFFMWVISFHENRSNCACVHEPHYVQYSSSSFWLCCDRRATSWLVFVMCWCRCVWFWSCMLLDYVVTAHKCSHSEHWRSYLTDSVLLPFLFPFSFRISHSFCIFIMDVGRWCMGRRRCQVRLHKLPYIRNWLHGLRTWHTFWSSLFLFFIFYSHLNRMRTAEFPYE